MNNVIKTIDLSHLFRTTDLQTINICHKTPYFPQKRGEPQFRRCNKCKKPAQFGGRFCEAHY